MTDTEPHYQEQAATPEPCDHHWASHHSNGVSALVCTLCHWPDLDEVAVREQHLAHVAFCSDEDGECRACEHARAAVKMQCLYCSRIFPGTGRDGEAYWTGDGRWYCSEQCVYPTDERRAEVRAAEAVTSDV